MFYVFTRFYTFTQDKSQNCERAAFQELPTAEAVIADYAQFQKMIRSYQTNGSLCDGYPPVYRIIDGTERFIEHRLILDEPEQPSLPEDVDTATLAARVAEGLDIRPGSGESRTRGGPISAPPFPPVQGPRERKAYTKRETYSPDQCLEQWADECVGPVCFSCGFCPTHAYEANRQGEGSCGDCKERKP